MKPSYATAVTHGFAPLGAPEALDASPKPKKTGGKGPSAVVPVTIGVVALGLAGVLLFTGSTDGDEHRGTRRSTR